MSSQNYNSKKEQNVITQRWQTPYFRGW